MPCGQRKRPTPPRGKPATESGDGLGSRFVARMAEARAIKVREHRSQGGQASGSTTEEPPEEAPAG